MYDNEILPSNFTIFRNGRTSRGGDVMFAIETSIESFIPSKPLVLMILSYSIPKIKGKHWMITTISLDDNYIW